MYEVVLSEFQDNKYVILVKRTEGESFQKIATFGKHDDNEEAKKMADKVCEFLNAEENS